MRNYNKYLIILWILFSIIYMRPEIIVNNGIASYMLQLFTTAYGLLTLSVIMISWLLLLYGIKKEKCSFIITSCLLSTLFTVYVTRLHITRKILSSIIDNGIDISTEPFGQLYITNSIMNLARESFFLLFVVALIVTFMHRNKTYKKSLNQTSADGVN